MGLKRCGRGKGETGATVVGRWRDGEWRNREFGVEHGDVGDGLAVEDHGLVVDAGIGGDLGEVSAFVGVVGGGGPDVGVVGGVGVGRGGCW